MDSKYLAAASQAIIDAAKLNNEQIMQVKSYEDQIKLVRGAESNAHRLINDDVKSGKLDQNLAIVEKAKVTAEINVQVTTLEQAIRKIFPSWTSNALEAAKKTLNDASNGTIEGSGKAGEILGEHVLKVPFQSFKNFFGALKDGVKKSI
jgi:phenylalanyl-tRNA synthetase alpha subunit